MNAAAALALSNQSGGPKAVQLHPIAAQCEPTLKSVALLQGNVTMVGGWSTD